MANKECFYCGNEITVDGPHFDTCFDFGIPQEGPYCGCLSFSTKEQDMGER